MDNHRRRIDNNDDNEPHSRLFVICDKAITEDHLRKAFEPFGDLKDVHIPKDRNTGLSKGVGFVRFYKTSDAAAAVEAMHGNVIQGSCRPLRVMVAVNPSEVQPRDDGKDQNDQYKRLFIFVAKTSSENDLKSIFSQYGNVTNVDIQRDHHTMQSKGMAYVTFSSFLDAARAYEQCEPMYKATFAKPKASKHRQETFYESNLNQLAETPNQMAGSIIPMLNAKPEGYTRVNVRCSPYLTYYHIQTLFDIIPGMTDCQYTVDLVQECGKGTITYSNPISASYAFHRLNNFENPPGCRMFVQPDTRSFGRNNITNKNIVQSTKNLKNAIQAVQENANTDLKKLADAIAEASRIMKAATGSADAKDPAADLNYCSVDLPPPQPLAHIDSQVAKRCFLVCKPQPPPIAVLKDIFSRFGNLIDVYTLSNKTVGYALYAVAESADKAREHLHGADVCGIRMKVLEAEDEDPSMKRKRMN